MKPDFKKVAKQQPMKDMAVPWWVSWYECLNREKHREVARKIWDRAVEAKKRTKCTSDGTVVKLNKGRDTASGSPDTVKIPCDNQIHTVAWGVELLMKSGGKPSTFDPPCTRVRPSRKATFFKFGTDYDEDLRQARGHLSVKKRQRWSDDVKNLATRLDRDLEYKLHQFVGDKSWLPSSPAEELRPHDAQSAPAKVPRISCEFTHCKMEIIPGVSGGGSKKAEQDGTIDTTPKVSIDFRVQMPTGVPLKQERGKRGWALAMCITAEVICKGRTPVEYIGEWDNGQDGQDGGGGKERIYRGDAVRWDSCGCGLGCECSGAEVDRAVSAMGWAARAGANSNGGGGFWELANAYSLLRAEEAPNRVVDGLLGGFRAVARIEAMAT